MEFFNVTTIKNLSTVQCAIKQHQELHCFDRYTIICPLSDYSKFKSVFSINRLVQVVSENDLISVERFQEISDAITDKYCGKKINKRRINWYYQQVLKLTYALQSTDPQTVMWDADTVPICKINFFNKTDSIIYGSQIEYHADYFTTLKEIFHFDNPKYAMTIQFFTLAKNEKQHLKETLRTYLHQSKNDTTAEWLTKIVAGAVASAHSDLPIFEKSYFSEQELVGVSNLKHSNSSQKTIKHFRPGRQWSTTKFKVKWLGILGYKYYTIERYFQNQHRAEAEIYFAFYLVYDILRSLRFFNKK
ncbi:DUF6492 family protein [Paracoccaceae bacterium]|nr:DUF6492 family protein [Paracoccaceae bacterium]